MKSFTSASAYLTQNISVTNSRNAIHHIVTHSLSSQLIAGVYVLIKLKLFRNLQTTNNAHVEILCTLYIVVVITEILLWFRLPLALWKHVCHPKVYDGQLI
jgi:hypothetical protein